MGGPMSANDDGALPWLREEKELVAAAVRSGKPFWGVCLGVQLLAASLGARVYAGAEPEVGVLPVELTEEGAGDPVFSVLPPTLPALQWHGDTFELPKGAVRLAGSPAYPNQAFRFENAYGVQFHLEVSRDMAREWMEVPEYANALERTIGGETLLRALDERVDEMLDHGQALFERFLDLVVRTSSFNAVRLEA
jgi:GMP synthase (glutamine-hydrolysing)